MTRLPGSASGPCFAAPHSPWPRPFAPRAPQQPRLALFARFLATLGRSDFSTALIIGYGLRPSPISRFPCKRLLRMPGSTTTRGRLVSRCIDTGRVAFCGTKNISTPNLSYAAQYLACALPRERFTSALADNPCITRGRCGLLLLHRDGLPPSTFCRSPGALVQT